MKTKRFFSLLLASLMIFSSICISAQASTADGGGATILTESVPQEVTSMANMRYAHYIQSATSNYLDFALPSADISEYTMGQPIKIFSTEEQRDYDVYYFPVICGNHIVSILTVLQSGEELTASFGKGFAEELESLMLENTSQFILASTDNGLEALSADAKIMLQESPQREETADTLSDVTEINYNDFLSTSQIANELTWDTLVASGPASIYDPGGPDYYKKLSVPYVPQVKSNWCWSAVCASIINYKRGTSLTARDVVVQVLGDDINQTGTNREIMDAYDYWNISYTYMVPNNYAYVKNQIAVRNSPIHVALLPNNGAGHMVALVGVQEWDGVLTYLIIDPLQSTVQLIEVTSEQTQFPYVVGGSIMYWKSGFYF